MILSMFADREPPSRAGIDLRLCAVSELVAERPGAQLIMADPPWSYNVKGENVRSAEEHYALISNEDIAADLEAAYDMAAPGARLVVWCTFPKLGEWFQAFAGSRWRYVTGGAWGKDGGAGIGYHWRGRSEIVLVYVKGSPGRPSEAIPNFHLSTRERHSEKPVDWLRAMIRAWSGPGEVVVDLYAGLAPVARACVAEGRGYLGAEIDPERRRSALEALAAYRP